MPKATSHGPKLTLTSQAESYTLQKARYNLKAARGGGIHDLADALVWNLCNRPDQYNETVARFFAKAKKGDSQQAVDDFLNSLDAPSGVNPPAAVNPPAELQKNVVKPAPAPIKNVVKPAPAPMKNVVKPTPAPTTNVTTSDADTAKNRQPAAINPPAEVQADVAMRDADATETPATATAPRDVPSDVMESAVANVDTTNINMYGMKRFDGGAAGVLFKMPHCTCVINDSALKKWRDWVDTHMAEEEAATCPVVGCKDLLDESSFICPGQ